jgi:hypothetical protein
MDAILIDIENTHGDLLNDILLTVGCPIRWLAIRDINDFDNILQKNIIAIYCLPFAMDGVSTKSLNKIIELQEQGAIFITPLDNDKNDLAQVCNFVVTKPIT